MSAKTNKPAILKNWYKLLALLLFVSCFNRKDKPVASIYHWKTIFSLDSTDSMRLDSLGVKRLYIRFFDIDTELEKITPKGVVVFQSFPPQNLEVVPCIFITNRTMKSVPDSAIKTLAEHMYGKIGKLKKDLKNPIPEIQLDCDWTEDTKNTYFKFVEEVKILCKADGLLLSATIRLHQVKYSEKTGIPPADRGMLMFYNMGKVKEYSELNSILNLTTAEKYLDRLNDYPLALDLALPLFSWGVQFRDNTFEKLNSSWNRSELNADTMFVREGDNWFRANSSGLFKKDFILKNDRVRIEESNPEMAIEAIKLIESYLKKDPKYISLFHYNPHEIETYSSQAVKKIYGTWH